VTGTGFPRRRSTIDRGACVGAAVGESKSMQRIAIAVAASILAAVGFGSPAHASPQSLPHETHAAAARAPLLLPVRYRRRHRRRHEAAATAAVADAGAIKPGQWEFAAQLEAAALPQPGATAAPGPAAGGGATKSTYAICVAPDKAVPSAFVAGCRLDAVHRDGGHITWSMTCTNRQNAVRSDGVAQYRGDTMTATMVSHLPSAKAGKTIDVAQYIAGHYLGPCPSATTTAAAATASVAATANAGTASRPPPTEATAAAATPTPSAPVDGSAATAEPQASTAAPTEASGSHHADEHAAHHRRYRRHRRHYAYRRRRYYGYYGGGGFYGNGTYHGLGPNPYSANGD
jgi:Protein of unknown function (DUF3617)